MADSGTEWTRRGTLRTIGGSLVGGALVSGTADVATGQTGESWPQFRYDDSRTGYAPGNVGPVADVSPEWVFETSENLGEDGAEWSSPAVVDGTLYIGRKVDNTVYAVDIDDGTEEWRFVTNGGVTSSPAVADGTVYIGSSDDTVYALDATDGEEQWQYLSESASGPDDIDSSPTVVDGILYVGSSNGRVYALDADTGRERWTFETGESVRSSPAVVGGTVYIGSGDSTVYALDADTGRERWSFETGDRIWESSPAVVDGTLYIGSGDNVVYALDADDGTERWSFETDDTVKSSPAVADGTVYVGSWDDYLYALDADDGTERWSFDTGFGPSSSPAVVDGTVYVGDDSGKVVAVSADGGTEQWSFGTGEESVVSSPAVANGTVYIGANDSNVYALTGETATPTPEPTPEPTATPVPADDEFGDGEGGGGGGGGGGDTGGGSGQTEAILTLGGGIAALGGLWYWRRQGSGESDADDRPGGGTRTADTPDGGPGSGGVDTGSPGGGSAGAAVVDDSPPPGVDTHADALETGDDRRQEAAALADRGDHREALAALDDAETAYLDALDAARSTDRLDTGQAEERLAAVDDDRREIRRDRLAARRDALRVDLDRAADRIDDDPERASERLSSLESRIGALGERAGEMGFDDLRETVSALESERASLLADAEASLTGGPPTRIPRAPAVSVDYDALTDEEPIGAGGNADVVRATLPTTNGDVTLAIKRPRMSGTLHTDAIDRMLDEAETWDKLDDHDHVVGVVDYGAQPVPWIAMEYMEGGDLSERAGDLEFDQALWTAVAITKGVRHAHRRGVAHLDLKPANVLFRGVGGAWDVPKVADWGLSKHLLDHSQSVEGLSPKYAAPEQFDTDRGAADDITDVYQLGAVLYELFTGRPPFEGTAPAEAMHRVLNEEPAPPSEVAALPPELDDVLLTALEKEKGDRFESVLLLRNELQRLRGD